jgi:hypothetical protein
MSNPSPNNMFRQNDGAVSVNFVSGEGALQTPAALPSIPLYVAAFIVTLSGLYAVNFILPEDDTLSFMKLTLGLTTLGFLVSFISRKQNISPRSIQLPAVILGAFFFLLAVLNDSMLNVLAPPGVGDDKARSLAVLLSWLAVFRSFTLVNDASLLFCCVPTLALIGLASTMSVEPALVTLFVIYVAASAFLMVHENFLRTRSAQSATGRGEMGGLLFGSQLQLTLVCILSAMLLAQIVVLPMRQIGGLMLFSAGLIPPGKISRDTTAPTRFSFTEEDEKPVGTGPVTTSNQIVMLVQANSGANWRGASFDWYTGRGWRNSMSRDRNLSPQNVTGDTGDFLSAPISSGFNTFNLPVTTITKTAPGKILRQRVTLRSGLFSEIYAAAEPRRIRTYEERLQADAAGSIHLFRSIQGQSYEVESEIPDSSPEALKAASALYDTEIARRYLRLPDTPAIAHIRDTARQVVAGLKTPYEKARALEEWVGKQCQYNTQAGAVPAGEDVVENFLFTSRQGYCDSFATSLAVLCRASGIPARVASGFTPGEFDNVSREFIVRERDKHMWTEVYFPNSGWITFDSTAFAVDISPDSSDPHKSRLSFIAFLLRRGWIPPMALFAFVCMLLYVLKVEVVDRIRGKRNRRNALGLPETNLAIISVYEQATGELARRGLARPTPMTPVEYLKAVSTRFAAWPEACSALERLTTLVVRFRYSRETALPEDVGLAQNAFSALRQVLKRVGRRAPAIAASNEQGP